MWVKYIQYVYLKILFQVIYVCLLILSYQQPASFSQGKSKHIYKNSKTTALLKYYYLIGLPNMIYNQRSAISGQRSAVSGRRSAVSGQRSAVGSQQSAVSSHSCRSLRHAQLSSATLASSNITASAVISTVVAVSAVVITVLLSCVI